MSQKVSVDFFVIQGTVVLRKNEQPKYYLLLQLLQPPRSRSCSCHGAVLPAAPSCCSSARWPGSSDSSRDSLEHAQRGANNSCHQLQPSSCCFPAKHHGSCSCRQLQPSCGRSCHVSSWHPLPAPASTPDSCTPPADSAAAVSSCVSCSANQWAPCPSPAPPSPPSPSQPSQTATASSSNSS